MYVCLRAPSSFFWVDGMDELRKECILRQGCSSVHGWWSPLRMVRSSLWAYLLLPSSPVRIHVSPIPFHHHHQHYLVPCIKRARIKQVQAKRPRRGTQTIPQGRACAQGGHCRGNPTLRGGHPSPCCSVEQHCPLPDPPSLVGRCLVLCSLLLRCCGCCVCVVFEWSWICRLVPRTSGED